jgi:hypothetical protein
MKVKITKVNKEILSNLVKQMVTVNKFVTMRIDSESTSAIGYFPSHDVVKMYSVTNGVLFESIEAHEKPIRVSITNGLEILLALRNYRDEDIDIMLQLDESEGGEELYAYKMSFVYERLTIELSCADKTFSEKTMSPLAQDLLDRLFDTTNKNCSFVIDSNNMGSIKSLSSIDKAVRSFGYSTDADGVVRIYEKRYSDDDDADNDYYVYNMILVRDAVGESEKHSYMCNKNIFAIMQDKDWNVDICRSDGKIVYNSMTDETTEKVTIIGVINDIA